MFCIGLMSGTSLDGVDIALLEIEGASLNTKIKLLGFETVQIPENIKEEIKMSCLEEKSSVDMICSLNFKLGKLYSDGIKEVCNKYKFDINKLDFIASHGQTIYHIPKSRGNLVPSTLQIGEPSVIAYETGINVISNFRVMDMAAGGEGAPLVPFTEYVLYGHIKESIALQNIGGIGNVTVIPESKNIDEIYAFDTGPGNMTIDEACQCLYNVPYDKDGIIGASGNVSEEMLDDLMSHPYISKIPPKTTGREDFGEVFVKNYIKKYIHLNKEDIIATFTMFTAKTIGDNYKKFVLPKTSIKKLIIGGGGAHNKTLIKFIQDQFEDVKVLTQEELGYSSDAKEAIAFAILGNETIHNSFSNVPSATGAKEKVVLGNITLGKNKGGFFFDTKKE